MAEQKTELEFEEFAESELPLLVSLLSFNSEHLNSVYADSTVVKSPEVATRGELFAKNTDILGKEYLENSDYPHRSLMGVMGVSRYEEVSAVLSNANRDLKHRPESEPSEVVELPEERELRVPLSGVVRSRRSVREYRPGTMSLEELATVLFHAQGITEESEIEAPESEVLGRDPTMSLRATQSGGGLYPITLHVVALDVDELDRAVYQYLPEHHSLLKRREFDAEEVERVAPFEYFGLEIEDATAMIGFEYHFRRNARKYGRMALRFGLWEVGAISEMVHLSAVGLGLGTCDVGGYNKRPFENLLGLNNIAGHAVHSLVMGYRT